MRVAGLHHISFTVSDLERAVDFYRRLGFEPESRLVVADAAGIGGELAMQFMTCAGVRIELLRYERGSDQPKAAEGSVGDAHFALQVDDIERCYQELTAAGVEFAVPPRYLERADATWAILLDPDGIRVELVQPGESAGAG